MAKPSYTVPGSAPPVVLEVTDDVVGAGAEVLPVVVDLLVVE